MTASSVRCLALALALPFAVGACHRDGAATPASAGVQITLAGSSALVPLATEAANRYMRAHPGVTLQVSAGGSRQGLAQVAAGAVTIGDSDVFAPADQAGALEDHKIAVVAFAPMANKGPFNAGVGSLTQDQLRGVFTGQVRNWSAVGGTDQAITVINRARNSGTRAVFGAIVMGGDNFVEGTAEQDNSGQLQGMLTQQVGAISYLALSYRTPALQVFSYNGVEATPTNVESGRYPIWSYEHMYTRGPATAAVRAFLDFMLSPEVQNDVIPRMNFIPVARMLVSRDHD